MGSESGNRGLSGCLSDYAVFCRMVGAGLDYSADYILPHGSYLINLGNPDAYVVSTWSYLYPYQLNIPLALADQNERFPTSVSWTTSNDVNSLGFTSTTGSTCPSIISVTE